MGGTMKTADGALELRFNLHPLLGACVVCVLRRYECAFTWLGAGSCSFAPALHCMLSSRIMLRFLQESVFLSFVHVIIVVQPCTSDRVGPDIKSGFLFANL